MEENKVLQLTAIDTNNIKDLIHIIRGIPVMLDYDLAPLYGYDVKRLNEQVKRNTNRFPEDFVFRITREEYEILKSQNATSSSIRSNGQWGGRRKYPFAFTEQGIYMLATVLKGQVAEQQSIFIMRAFREMRHFIADNRSMFERISTVELRQLEYEKKTNQKLDQVFAYISEHAESSEKIFFEGQIFDAFSLLASLIQKAERNIVLIDGYVDINTLNILAKKQPNTVVTICTHPNTSLTDTDIQLFNKQYPSLIVTYSSAFHDRFLIIDETTVYHIGASLKDAGKKCFAITQIVDPAVIKELNEYYRTISSDKALDLK